MIEIKNSSREEGAKSRGRNIPLGAAFGLLIGGGLDWILGDSGWALVIGILLGAFAGYWINFPLPAMQYPAYIVRRIVLSAVIFFVFLFGSQWLLDQGIGEAYQVLIALAPIIPAIFLGLSIASAIAQLDELQRRIQPEAIGITFLGSVIITFSYASLVQVGVPELNWVIVPLLMLILWGIGKLWTMWKYR